VTERRLPPMVDGALTLAQLDIAAQVLEDDAPGERITPAEFVEWLRMHVGRPVARPHRPYADHAGKPGRKRVLTAAMA
jgi:hypothetical protein